MTVRDVLVEVTFWDDLVRIIVEIVAPEILVREVPWREVVARVDGRKDLVRVVGDCRELVVETWQEKHFRLKKVMPAPASCAKPWYLTPFAKRAQVRDLERKPKEMQRSLARQMSRHLDRLATKGGRKRAGESRVPTRPQMYPGGLQENESAVALVTRVFRGPISKVVYSSSIAMSLQATQQRQQRMLHRGRLELRCSDLWRS